MPVRQTFPSSEGSTASASSPFDFVYRGVLRGLYEGRFVPGQRLAAPDLMRQFDVGRGTIREVLHRLVSTGAVTIIPNKGAQVRRLARSEVAEILDTVEVLLGLAARGAAIAISDPAKARLLSDHHDALRPEKLKGDFPDFLQAREAYYRCVVQLSSNRELRRIFPAIQVHIMRVQLRHFGRAADAADFEDYIAITDAILSGDPQGAETAGRQHVLRTVERVALLPDSAFEAER